MKYIIILLIGLLFTSNSWANNLNDSNKLFDWAESSYPQYFSPAGAKTETLDKYLVRFYSSTNIYLGTASDQVYVYGEPFGGLLKVGKINDFINTWYIPAQNAPWHWQLLSTINESYAVDIYDIDLFDSDKALIQRLQSSGKKVICYFSAGSYENFREDVSLFDSKDLGKILDGWENEQWVDIRSESIRTIMKKRLDLAQSKGCDGVEPDNMDGYQNDSGFELTATDQLDFNQYIAEQAHQRNLSVGLKNDLAQIVELVDYFDFAVNEQCFEFNECDLLLPFIEQGKAVFNVEYDGQFLNNSSQFNALCSYAKQHSIYSLVLPLDLDDAFRNTCVE